MTTKLIWASNCNWDRHETVPRSNFVAPKRQGGGRGHLLSLPGFGARLAAAMLIGGFTSSPSAARNAEAQLQQVFAAPPPSARPRLWWHWLDGNVSKDGIKEDLAWMKRIGAGGFQLFDYGVNGPIVVDKPVGFMQPRWFELVRYAAEEASRDGLEMTIAAPGMMLSGGPWVRPEDAMKKLVWSELTIQGGVPLAASLPPLPTRPGPFQDLPAAKMPIVDPATDALLESNHVPHGDVRVLAFRTPAAEHQLRAAKIRASGRLENPETLQSGSFSGISTLKLRPHSTNWIEFDFGAPVTVEALQIAGPRPEYLSPTLPNGSIAASNDGISYRLLRKLPSAPIVGMPPGELNYKEFAQGYPPVYTVNTPPTTARIFRIYFSPIGKFAGIGMPRQSQTEIPLAAVKFFSTPRIERAEGKAGFVALPIDASMTSPNAARDAVIDPASILDVTSKLTASGRLDWTPPAGRWTIMRFGWSLTGERHVSRAGAAGLEIDKLSKFTLTPFVDHYFGAILKELGASSGAAAFRSILTDSSETGQANWTEDLLGEFQELRGYDATPYLPVLAGRIVGSTATSERFLWDFRRTLADLLAQNHNGALARYARAHGLGYYAETMGIGLPNVGDGLQLKRYPTIPMGEFWQIPPGQQPSGAVSADLREAASAAHVYGQNIAAAESFTAAPAMLQYRVTPLALKPLADWAMVQGINSFSIHTSVHQPVEGGVGLNWGFGQNFTRKEIWAEFAAPWIEYLTRCSALLQQGRAAADIAYFYGEDVPVSVPDEVHSRPQIPFGYAYDYVSRDALVGELRAHNGEITTRSGQRYSLLVMPLHTQLLSVTVLRKVKELVEEGAVVAGQRPVGSPSLSDSQAEARSLIDQIWGAKSQRAASIHVLGRGRVFEGFSIAAVLNKMGLRPDVQFYGDHAGSIGVIHRRLGAGELYFVSNDTEHNIRTAAIFRVRGYAPEIWDASTGEQRPVTYQEIGSSTRVPVVLGPHESRFVVFARMTNKLSRVVPRPSFRRIGMAPTEWTINFRPARGLPFEVVNSRLGSWTKNTDERVRYFSGIGTYIGTLHLSASEAWGGGRTFLDLGRVDGVARVTINGKPVGIAWKPPYRLDITNDIEPGENVVRLEVANVWANALIGCLKRHDMLCIQGSNAALTATSPLQPSGVLGPITVVREMAR
jgi:hypothetical protein